MKILAIETSCDETAAAVLEVNRGIFNLKSNIVSSQVKIHAKYGGIVPEVAARKQMEMIIPVLGQTLKQASSHNQETISKNIDYLAVTQGPGLVTSLTVGVETAKTLAMVLDKPLVAVNHLAGHIYANLLTNNKQQTTNNPSTSLRAGQQAITNKIKFPALALVVSGGHTLLVLMKKHNQFQVVGETLDDAAGEAFDKVAKILELGYPGGPIISKLAVQGDPQSFNLPRPMIHSRDFNFSFAGLKTAVLYLVKKLKSQKVKKEMANLCASFQQAVADVLVAKTIQAAKKYQPRAILLGGGVAANLALRKQLAAEIDKQLAGVNFLMPELKFTGDNAAMIATAAYFKIINNQLTTNSQQLAINKIRKLKAEPNLSLS